MGREIFRPAHRLDQLFDLSVLMLVEKRLLLFGQHIVVWLLVRILGVRDRLLLGLGVFYDRVDNSVVGTLSLRLVGHRGDAPDHIASVVVGCGHLEA